MDTRRVGRAVVSNRELRCHMAAEPTQKEQLQIHSSSSCWKGLRDRESLKKPWSRKIWKNIIVPRVVNMV